MSKGKSITSYSKFVVFGIFCSVIMMINGFFGAFTIYGLYNFGLTSLFDEFLFPFLAFSFLFIAFSPMYKTALNFRYLRLINKDKIEISEPYLAGNIAGPPLGFPLKHDIFKLIEVSEISSSKILGSLITISFIKEGKQDTFKSFLKRGEYQKLKDLINQEIGKSSRRP